MESSESPDPPGHHGQGAKSQKKMQKMRPCSACIPCRNRKVKVRLSTVFLLSLDQFYILFSSIARKILPKTMDYYLHTYLSSLKHLLNFL